MANTKMNKSVHLDLFHEIKNNSFIAFQNLSNAFLDTQNLTEQEIQNLFLFLELNFYKMGTLCIQYNC